MGAENCIIAGIITTETTSPEILIIKSSVEKKSFAE
jgi:hypothetical protein